MFIWQCKFEFTRRRTISLKSRELQNLFTTEYFKGMIVTLKAFQEFATAEDILNCLNTVKEIPKYQFMIDLFLFKEKNALLSKYAYIGTSISFITA